MLDKMKTTRRQSIKLLGATVPLAAFGTAAWANTEDEIVIGASLPISGQLAGLGSYANWGYNHAVNEVNKAGGILVAGKPHRIRLVIRDDKTDPNVTASNTNALISRDGAVAILASLTPPLVASGGLIAERNKVPFISGCCPTEEFAAIRHWRYGWDMFFSAVDLSTLTFRMLEDMKLPTNHKVSIFHDNGPDGTVLGAQLWPVAAKKFGYNIVQNASFPMEATEFTSIVTEAKAMNADIVLAMCGAPQAVALRKQMAATGWTPKIMSMERGGEPAQFQKALGSLADGVLVGGYWSSSFPYPGASALAKLFEEQTGETNSQDIATSYTVTRIMLDAIARANSLDAEKITEEIGQTNGMYVVGPVKFDSQHIAVLPLVETQWQASGSQVVWPVNRSTAKIIFPVPA